MNKSIDVERIAKYLERSDFRRLAEPLKIAGIAFEVGAALLGNPPFQDLIIVADAAFDKEERILRTVQAIARALDVGRSTRPLTLVVAGARPMPQTMEALSKVCRVLPVNVAEDGNLQAVLENWLAVLQRLTIPEPQQAVADPMGQIANRLDGIDPQIANLIQFAHLGSAAVQKQLHSLLNSTLSEVTEK